MKRAAILIGVNRVKGLPILNDAVRGAHEMRAWALAQGLSPDHVALITDEQESVAPLNVQSAIERFLDPMAGFEQLLIYFAGHGLNINYGEFWLLSQALDRPTDSIDVARSAILARYGSIPHVIFISDACRTAAAGIQQQFITGSPVFPTAKGGNLEKSVDQFFSCTLGNPALEAQIQDPRNSSTFSALYTKVLLATLGGAEPTIIEPEINGQEQEWVIRPWPLKSVLHDKVNALLAEERISTSAFQTPDARISSDPKLASISRLGKAIPPSVLDLIRATRLKHRFDALEEPSDTSEGRYYFDRPAFQVSEKPEIGQSDWLSAEVNRVIDGLPKRESSPESLQTANSPRGVKRRRDTTRYIEGGSGLELRGTYAKKVICKTAKLIRSNRGRKFMVDSHSEIGIGEKALVIFADGSGAIVPLFPGLIAVLSVRSGRWTDLAYEDRTTSASFGERRLHQLIALAFERGTFQVQRPALAKLIDHAMTIQPSDPVLLLYLAYAAFDSGLMGKFRDCVHEMNEQKIPILFDVALLTNSSYPTTRGTLLPDMPLLSRGWPFFETFSDRFTTKIDKISRMRYPGLWSHFTPDAVQHICGQLIPPELIHET